MSANISLVDSSADILRTTLLTGIGSPLIRNNNQEDVLFVDNNCSNQRRFIIIRFLSELQERQTHDHNEPPKIAAKETP